MSTIIANAITAIRSKELRTEEQIIAVQTQQETQFAEGIKRVIDKLVSTIEQRLTDYNMEEWIPIYECGNVYYLAAGKGIYVAEGVWAQVMAVENDVLIMINDGVKLAEFFTARAHIGLAYGYGRTAGELIHEYADSLKARGVRALKIKMAGFEYGNAQELQF